MAALLSSAMTYALSTLPERRHLVQTYTLLGEPLTIAFTLLTFGFQVLLERLCEWETLIPNVISFPQYSHFAISEHLLVNFERIDITTYSAKLQVFFILFFYKGNFLLIFNVIIDFILIIYYNNSDEKVCLKRRLNIWLQLKKMLLRISRRRLNRR